MTQNNYPEGLDELAVSAASSCDLFGTKQPPDVAAKQNARALLDALAKRGYVLVDAKKKEPVAWQPIETAPKDGTSFDIWVKSTKNPDYGIRMTSVYFNNDVICGRRFPDVSFGEFASHWMPLPAAPDAAMGASNG